MSSTPSVYDYDSSGGFLRDAWKHRRVDRPSFSLGAWAKRLGFETNTPLSLMMAGKRPIPKKYLPAICRDLGLNASESLYFETLNDFCRARSREDRRYYQERLDVLAPRQRKPRTEIEVARVLADPLHYVVGELVTLPDFKDDLRWMRGRLKFKVSLDELRDVYERLQALGLLVRDSSGRFVRSYEVLTNRVDEENEAVQEGHRKVSEWARDLISQVPVREREFNGFAFNLRCDDLEASREEIRRFLSNFINKYEAEDDGDETYQLNLQFFPVTEKKKRNRK